MDDEDIARFVVKELSKFRPTNDVVRSVCEKTGLQWDDARQVVSRIRDERVGEIISHNRFPIVILGLGTVFGGLALCILIILQIQEIIYINEEYLYHVLLSVAPHFSFGLVIIAAGVLGIMKAKRRR